MAQSRAQRFKAPPGVMDCKTVIVKELDGDDEIAAAVAADARAGQPGFKADNFAALLKLERIEKVRQSIVAVDDKLVNQPGRPFVGYDKFHATTKLWLSTCYDQLNSLEGEDLKKSLAEAEQVDLSQLTSGAASTDEPDGG